MQLILTNFFLNRTFLLISFIIYTQVTAKLLGKPSIYSESIFESLACT